MVNEILNPNELFQWIWRLKRVNGSEEDMRGMDGNRQMSECEKRWVEWKQQIQMRWMWDRMGEWWQTRMVDECEQYEGGVHNKISTRRRTTTYQLASSMWRPQLRFRVQSIDWLFSCLLLLLMLFLLMLLSVHAVHCLIAETEERRNVRDVTLPHLLKVSGFSVGG